MIYLYTLDSHDCYGPFNSDADATLWAYRNMFTSYQLLKTPPYESTQVMEPWPSPDSWTIAN
jgi:hypothetical protein